MKNWVERCGDEEALPYMILSMCSCCGIGRTGKARFKELNGNPQPIRTCQREPINHPNYLTVMINPSTSVPSERTTVRSATYPVHDRPFARISWGAVFAGAIIALATQIVLALIGMAVGLATLNPATGDSPSGTALGTGAAIWLVVSSLISL